MDISRRHDLFAVEDATQGVNAKCYQHYRGTIRKLGTYSIRGAKNYTCGERSAFVIDNGEFVEKA